jgi:hypothetical protein
MVHVRCNHVHSRLFPSISYNTVRNLLGDVVMHTTFTSFNRHFLQSQDVRMAQHLKELDFAKRGNRELERVNKL